MSEHAIKITAKINDQLVGLFPNPNAQPYKIINEIILPQKNKQLILIYTFL